MRKANKVSKIIFLHNYYIRTLKAICSRDAAELDDSEKEEFGHLRRKVKNSKTLDEISPEDPSSSKIFTNSPEFRAFLQATFRLSSCGEKKE